MATGEQLKRLLSAFRNGDDGTFYRVANRIISDEAAANNHALARELKRALGGGEKARGELVVLPRDKRGVANLLNVHISDVTEDKLVFCPSTQRKIDRIIEEHRSAKRLADHGFDAKRKLLFWGAPGCGKTATANFLAHELGLPIGTVRLSALISSYLGDTSANMQAVFDLANREDMVLFLDEVDAVGKNRDDRNDVGEIKRVVNSLLQAMDGFKSKKSVVIAASNHQYLLDKALWRRFDDIVDFPLPGDEEIRLFIDKLLSGVQFRGKKTEIYKEMKGLSFADIERFVIEGVKSMILDNRKVLRANDILEQLESFKEDGIEKKDD